jgi:hypothetical protein
VARPSSRLHTSTSRRRDAAFFTGAASDSLSLLRALEGSCEYRHADPELALPLPSVRVSVSRAAEERRWSALHDAQSIERRRTYSRKKFAVNASNVFFLLSSIMEAWSRGYLRPRDMECHSYDARARSIASEDGEERRGAAHSRAVKVHVRVWAME